MTLPTNLPNGDAIDFTQQGAPALQIAVAALVCAVLQPLISAGVLSQVDEVAQSTYLTEYWYNYYADTADTGDPVHAEIYAMLQNRGPSSGWLKLLRIQRLGPDPLQGGISRILDLGRACPEDAGLGLERGQLLGPKLTCEDLPAAEGDPFRAHERAGHDAPARPPELVEAPAVDELEQLPDGLRQPAATPAPDRGQVDAGERGQLGIG